jgi:hypothetical protein
VRPSWSDRHLGQADDLRAKAGDRFGKQDFVYLTDEDAYRCPAGKKLRHYYSNVKRG